MYRRDTNLLHFRIEKHQFTGYIVLSDVTKWPVRDGFLFFFFFLINKYFFKHKNPIVWNKSNTVEMVKSKAWCHGRIGGGGCLMTQHVICREEKNQQRQRLFGNDWDNTLSALCFLSISFPTGRLFQV